MPITPEEASALTGSEVAEIAAMQVTIDEQIRRQYSRHGYVTIGLPGNMSIRVVKELEKIYQSYRWKTETNRTQTEHYLTLRPNPYKSDAEETEAYYNK